MRHIDRIALDRGLGDRLQAQSAERQREAVKAGLAVSIVLVKDRNFFQPQVGELLDDQGCLVVIGGANVKRIFVKGIAQCHGPGKRRDEGDFFLHGQRQRSDAGGRSNIAKQRKHVVGNQLFGVLHAAGRLIAIVELADFNLLARHAALGVDLVEADFGALVKLDAELRGGPGERRRLSQNDLAVGLGARHAETSQHGCTGGD